MSAVATRTLLSLRDLHVYLGQSHVLQGVTFDVPEGGVTALLGRNGVGKTTTLRAILGLVERRGSVRLGDVEFAGMPTHRIVRRRVGYVPEDRDVFTGLTVAENLRLAERDAEPRYDLVYELFPDLEARAAQRAGTLSGGQLQMVAIARALLNDNRLLLVDEPTKGLAPSLVVEVAQVLERLAELTTVLLVEQNLGVVRRIARDVIVLDQGRVVHTGDAKELVAQPELVRSCSASVPHEHLRAPHDHRPRPRRDVLPDRRRALAHLRADGRPQLRARRVHHVGSYGTWWASTHIFDGVGSALWRFLLSAAFGLVMGVIVAALVELVLIRPLWRHIEQVLVTVGLQLAFIALITGVFGPDPKVFLVPPWLHQTTDVAGAQIPNDRWIEILVAAVVLGLLQSSCGARATA